MVKLLILKMLWAKMLMVLLLMLLLSITTTVLLSMVMLLSVLMVLIVTAAAPAKHLSPFYLTEVIVFPLFVVLRISKHFLNYNSSLHNLLTKF